MLKLYNTLSRTKEEFVPLKKSLVGMYCCGPTVYDYAHIGNLRTYIFEDVLRRVLELNEFKVKHVVNITDVGHLTSDADEGEDKMVKALHREGLDLSVKSMLKLADKYTFAFKNDIKALNILEPSIWCRATEHIEDMIKMIKKLEKNGFAYYTSGGLVYDTSKFKNYAQLGRLKLSELKEGARIKKDSEKRNPSDFALWINNQSDHLMQWDSPFGKGFPGWHVECSAMSTKYLGDQFDIHCGGIDHIPVHHTNEIAQTEGATGKHSWVKYWVHGEFLVLDKGKMSKSSGGFLTLKTLIDKNYGALDYRYFCLGAHYRTPLVFSWEGLDAAKNAFNNLKEKVLEFKQSKDLKGDITSFEEEFLKSVNDDLNMPKALAVVWSVIKSKDIGDGLKYKLLLRFDNVLGLGLNELKIEKVPAEILELARKRDEARKNKDWALSDKLRDEINKKGYTVDDNKEGSVVRKI